MYPISAKQIKAARALLDWSQEDLAEASRISISTVRTMELGKIPRITTMRDICKTIEHNGLEFIDGEGVRRRDFNVLPIRGENSCDDLFEDVLKTVRENEGDVLVFTKSENSLTLNTGAAYRSNLDRLEVLQEVADIKCLLTGTAKPLFSRPSFPCRAITQRSCGASFCLVYGHKYAHLLPDGPRNFIAVTFNIASAADGERKDFLSLWENALPVNF